MKKMNWREIEKIVISEKDFSSEEKAFVIKKVNDYWENHPDVANRYPRWKKYIAWVAGYQMFDYSKMSKKLVEVPLARRRGLVFNKLKPFVRALLAKLSAEPHIPSVAPATDDQEDVDAARAGENLIRGLQTKIVFATELNNAKLWTIVCNKAYFRAFWNEDSYGETGVEEEEVRDEEGNVTEVNPVMTTDPGDLDIECVSPFNCRPDPLYTDRTKWRWFIYGEEVDAEELEEDYDLKDHSIKEESDVLDSAFDLELQGDEDLIVGSPGKSEDITGRTCVYKEFWTKKIWIFTAGNTILDYGAHNYGEIPYYDVEERLIPIGGYEKAFSYNESLIKDAIPIQREYNRQVSIMSLALDRASKLKVLAPIGSILNKKQWTNDYGVFIDYNRNMGEPHQMKLDPFPVEMPQYSQQLHGELENVMNLSPTSFGRLPERASHPSGTLVNLLVEQDDVVLNPLLNALNNAMGGAWSLGLRIVQENYNPSRLLQFTGEDGYPTVERFFGADLRGNTDVVFTTSSGLPKSRALRTEYVIKLHELGLIEDKKDTLELIEFGRANRVFRDQLLHEQKADRENALIENNPDITVEELQAVIYQGDDDPTHMKKHERLRLGSKYDRFTDAQKKALDWMLELHGTNMQKAQEGQVQQQIQMLIDEEMGKAQARTMIENVRSAGKMELGKLKVKGDLILEAVKQQGKLADELFKKSETSVYGGSKKQTSNEGSP